MDANSRRARASAEAAHWFVRLQSGDMQRPERALFVDWLGESCVHVAEILRIAQVHGALELFDRWSQISTTGSESDEDTVVLFLPRAGDDTDGDGRKREMPTLLAADVHCGSAFQPKRVRRTRRLISSAAAAVLLAIAGAVFLPTIRGQIINTERGERRQVVLNDGSVLQVDPETRLRVKFGSQARLVFLEQGRVLFHVAKSAQRPFLVNVDGTTIRAVGTAFGVEQFDHGVTVTVAEGKIAIVPTALLTRASSTGSPASTLLPVETSDGPSALTPQSGTLSSHPRPGKERKSSSTATMALFLTANQQVTLQSSGSAEAVREVDSRRELAWAEGRLIFHNDNVAKVLAEFNRYNRVQLSVTDPALASRLVSGVFDASDPGAFITFLQTVTPVQIARDGERTITIHAIR